MTAATPSLRSLDVQLEAQADLLCEVARKLPGLAPPEREELRSRALAFLQNEIVRHLAAEERVLYPTIGERLGDPLATAPLRYEHRAIRWWIDQIAHADVTDEATLQQLLYGVHALIRVHLSREEELYVGALESPAWPAAG